ncbi:DegQ family serine endoprotease [Desulfothermus okinawensis JCM 13304]
MKKIVSLFLVVGFLFVVSPCSGFFDSKQLPSFSDLAEKASPAVVNISTVKVVQVSKRLRRFFSPFGENDPFNEFFKKFFESVPPSKRKEHALGSGFIISPDGYIVTNNHVVSKADEITVILKGGKKSFKATVVGTDPETDLALLKIDAKEKLPYLHFGDSDKMRPGDWVIAIGNPFGLDHTVTAGIISAKGRVIGAGPYDNFLQTDASINPGNSGGPLLNLKGEVIGINTAIVASGQGIGFAIPSNMAKEVIEQLKKYKKVKRGWLGVTIQDVDENTAKALGLNEPKGALVASVLKGQPAQKAGIKVGDVIIAVNDKPVSDSHDLTRKIGQLPPHSKTKITIWRNGKVKELWITLGERKTNVALGEEGTPEGFSDYILGMKVREVTQEDVDKYNLDNDKGLLVVDVKPGSKAEESDIRPFDILLKGNFKELNSVDDLKEVIEKDAKKKGALLLLIRRKGQTIFRTIPLK